MLKMNFQEKIADEIKRLIKPTDKIINSNHNQLTTKYDEVIFYWAFIFESRYAVFEHHY